MTTTKEELARVKAGWNYADVIALVTANLPGEKFNGDRGAWHRGVYELSRKYPHLFRGVHFVRKDPYPPYSRQVDEILKMLERWEYRSSFNPRYRRIELGADAKEELKNALETKLADHLDTIKEMSTILNQHVATQEPDEAKADGDRAGEAKG